MTQLFQDAMAICRHFHKPDLFLTITANPKWCQGRAERERSDPDWGRVTPEWKRVDNKSGGTTLASARALCLDRLSRMWLRISGGLNCCQESRRGVV